MEKAFALKDNHISTNGGKVEIFKTIDPNIRLVVSKGPLKWENRGKEEVFRCSRCRTYIMPGQAKVRLRKKDYHSQTCSPYPKGQLVAKEEIKNGLLTVD